MDQSHFRANQPSTSRQSIPPRAHREWTFTQGLILGQASFLVLGLLFIRYVVFSPAEKVDESKWKKKRDEREKKALLSINTLPPPPPSHILSKVGYEMATHPAESSDWVNVLFAQVMQGYRNDLVSDGGEEGARVKIEKWLNPGGGMSWLDPIKITGISLGSSYPLFSNARIRPADGQGRLRAEIDMDYSDSLSLSLATSVLVNFPKPRFAVLPVALGVELASIGGTLSIQMHDPVDGQQHLHVCLLPDFHLDLKTTSLLGSRAKLQDIPKLEQLLVSRIRSVITDRFVHPHTLSLTLPRILAGSLSSKEFMADLGDEAVEVMSQAMRQGLGQIVSDLGLDALSQGSGSRSRNGSVNGSKAQTISGLSDFGLESENASRRGGQQKGGQTGIDTKNGANGASGSGGESRSPTSPTSPIRAGRKIHMPAGFPHSMKSSTTSMDPTPTQTPGIGGPSRVQLNGNTPSQPFGGPVNGVSGMGMNNPLSAVKSGTMNVSVGGGGGGTGGIGSGVEKENQDNLKFRGQFAGSSDRASNGSGVNGVNGSEARRLGALNSRAAG